ncbi:MAG: glycoside hydrolase family 3 C-terminal domain-containing protein [Clostridiales bacterium]|nr:glycoside hydrolase family 3 C-terminal domain-containing protein [Clostridiales bacterium]
MLQLLINLLTPLFTSMGVSASDVQSYANILSCYIYAILALIAVLIVVLIAAHWVKKGTRHVVRWSAVVAVVLVIGILANVICFGPMYSTLSAVLNGTVELSDETVAASTAVVQELGEDGIVLAKNDGLLPLSSDTTNLNVFGWASTIPIYGGTGSGSSSTEGNVSILQSLADAGYTTNETLTQMYTDYRSERPEVGLTSQDWTLPEPTVDYYTDEIMEEAKEFSDTAVIVISRSGGEGADLPTDMYAVIHGTYNEADVAEAASTVGYTNASYTNNGDYDDFDEGEHYLELSNTEEAMVELVCSNFDNVIVIINANNAMELGWTDEYDSISAVLLAPGAGVSGFTALGEILNGTLSPSGRTADTFVKDLTNTPTWNNIGSFTYTNIEDIQEANTAADASYLGTATFVNYVEGIYVGYKYYETASDDGVINYDDYVQYPFGYGLSYTTFEQVIENFSVSDTTITFDVTVTNTGSVAGKDVVEVYYTPPYTNGGIEKASVNLVQYAKTETLEVGASQTISFEIALEDMASYDSECLKTENGGYILEAGDYTISIRSDSHTVLDEETFTLDADIDYSVTGRESDDAIATNQFEDYSAGDVTYLSRADGFANYNKATAAPAEEDYEMDDETKAAVELSLVATYDSTLYDDDSDEMPTTEADNGLTLSDLTGLDYDDELWEDLLDQLSVDDMITLVCMGGFQTAEISSVGKVATSDCDGPAGVSNILTGAQGTAFGTEVLMAQTWNTELAYRLGEAMGTEYAEVDNYGWYGPAMNTHRSAFAGRNYEYYSEDGVLAGYFAAAQVNGAASKGVYAYIKHLALNDQETNRCAVLLTYSNEQAIREIYLKPFEICVKNYEGTGLAVMSSYNWIGTIPCGANGNLLNNVLRDEWGFQGFVETDYDGGFGYQIADHSVRTGNDLMLGFYVNTGNNEFSDLSATMVQALRQASKNILYVVGNSGYYTNESTSGGMSNMMKMFLPIDIIGGLVLVAVEAIVLVRWIRKRKAAADA